MFKSRITLGICQLNLLTAPTDKENYLVVDFPCILHEDLFDCHFISFPRYQRIPPCYSLDRNNGN